MVKASSGSEALRSPRPFTSLAANTVDRDMKKKLPALFTALCLLACLESSAAVVELDLEKLALRSSHIFRGEVVSIKSHWRDFLGLGKAMITDVRIRVAETWKDSPGDRQEIIRDSRATSKTPGRITEITIQYLGGRIGERWQKCAESPSFSLGEEVLVFARELNGGLWPTGWFQGKYRLKKSGPAHTGGGDRIMVIGSGRLPVKKPTEVHALRLAVRKILLRKKTGAPGTSKDGGSGK